MVHPGHYIEKVKRCARNSSPLAADTPLSERSYEVACQAVGSALWLGEKALAGESGFAALRPPGHHAEKEQGMGFCLFNNIAVLAEDMVRRGLRPVIVDIDVHHGNGTQNIFYQRGDVLYISFHQYPFYPGTGVAEETGIGPGEGTTFNIPLPAGAGWDLLEPRWQSGVLAVVSQFKPDILLVSAGFDAHRDDPLGGLSLSDEDFLTIAADLNSLADKYCRGRVVALLEGGYNTGTLRRLVPKFTRELFG